MVDLRVLGLGEPRHGDSGDFQKSLSATARLSADAVQVESWRFGVNSLRCVVEIW